MKTRYFKVTTESRRGKKHGDSRVESRVDVQELEIEPIFTSVALPDTFTVEPLGDARRICKSTPDYEIAGCEKHQSALGENIWRQISEKVFSFFLLDDFIEGFRKAIKK